MSVEGYGSVWGEWGSDCWGGSLGFVGVSSRNRRLWNLLNGDKSVLWRLKVGEDKDWKHGEPGPCEHSDWTSSKQPKDNSL